MTASRTSAAAAADAVDEIRDVQRMLHLAYHRNKNQHRGARWWGSLGVMRRQIGRLVGELEDVNRAGGLSVVSSKEKTKKKIEKIRDGMEREEGRGQRAARVEERVRFLREVVIGRCWLAFSTVVADTQYSALGLMLIGTLARLDSLIAPMAPESEASLAVPASDLSGGAMQDRDQDYDHVLAGEDLGEKVSREEVLGRDGGDLDLDVGLPTEECIKRKPGSEDLGVGVDLAPDMPMPTQTKKPTKKRRKKGDVFDELFSALI